MEKALEKLEHFYFQTKMRTNVRKYLGRWRVCQHAKGRSQNDGLHTPLPILGRPWDSMSMYFILGLLRMQQGKDSILVDVDIFTNMAHFIPCCMTYDATHMAHLFFNEIV